jgi:hypothetical protein
MNTLKKIIIPAAIRGGELMAFVGCIFFGCTLDSLYHWEVLLFLTFFCMLILGSLFKLDEFYHDRLEDAKLGLQLPECVYFSWDDEEDDDDIQ